MRLKLAIMEEQGIMGCVEEYSEPGRFGEVLIAIPCQEAVSDSPFGALDIAFVNKDGVICKAYRKVERGRYLFCEAAIAVLSRVSPDAEWTDEDASLALNVSRHDTSLASVSSDDDPWFKAGDCLHLVRGENDASHQVNWVIYAKEKTTDEELSALQSACV